MYSPCLNLFTSFLLSSRRSTCRAFRWPEGKGKKIRCKIEVPTYGGNGSNGGSLDMGQFNLHGTFTPFCVSFLFYAERACQLPVLVI